jgi:hypothetical protein
MAAEPHLEHLRMKTSSNSVGKSRQGFNEPKVALDHDLACVVRRSAHEISQ